MYTIDASVWINAFDQREQGYVDSRQFLQLVQTHKIEIAVPTLMLVEVAGTISRTRGDGSAAIAFAEAMAALPHVTFYPLDFSAAQHALTVAAYQKLRGADALYAALALQVGSTLVTLDKEQLNRLTGLVSTLTPTAAITGLMNPQNGENE